MEAGFQDWGEVSLDIDASVSNQDALQEALQDAIARDYPFSGCGPYLGTRFSDVNPDNPIEFFAKLGLWSWAGDYAITIAGVTKEFKASGLDPMLSLVFSIPVVDALRSSITFSSVRLEDQKLSALKLNLSYGF